ncbi:MAG: DUF2334 domain-containing protein [Bacteroidales bacterium]|nr:DUF2334 domain-containing protein [Bacteroidales bacterium]
MEDLLDTYSIRPLVGIIPHNEDPQQMIDAEDNNFWDKARHWQEKGWTIALHGYSHRYISDKGMQGLNPIWKRSEFAGVSLSMQCDKIREGINVLRGQSVSPWCFFAPSHTFDENTLAALRQESDIRIISDTIATKPYRYSDFVFIPQFGGSCRSMVLNGIYTFCLHPNSMRDEDFFHTEDFIKKYRHQFISFFDINLKTINSKSLLDRGFSKLYHFYRKTK